MSKTLIAVSGQTVDPTLLKKMPVDKEFRDAWHLEGDVVSVDMTKAKELHREKMRQVRSERFKETDALYMIAMQRNDTKELEKIVAIAEELRKVTDDPKIDKAKTPAELSKIWHEVLGEK